MIGELLGLEGAKEVADFDKRLTTLERTVSRLDTALFDLKNSYQATLDRFEKRVVMRTIRAAPASGVACSLASQCTLKPGYCPSCAQQRKEVKEYGF